MSTATSPSSSLVHRPATWMELFYDLVYVAAVSILAGQLSDDVTATGILAFSLLFIPVWWSWAGHTIFASRFSYDDNYQRLMTLLQMLAAAVMATQLKGALGPTSTGFVLSYVATRIVLLGLYLRAGRGNSEAIALSMRMITGYGVGSTLWVASIFVDEPLKFGLWAAGLIVEMATFVSARKISKRLPVHASHLPERLGLFVIIVLGEALMTIITGLSGVSWNLLAVGAALLSFTLAALIWWNYFAYVERAPLQCTLGTGQAYIFCHLPMLLGLIAIRVAIGHIIINAAGSFHVTSISQLLIGGTLSWVGGFYLLQMATYPRGEFRRLTRMSGVIFIVMISVTAGRMVEHPIVLLGTVGSLFLGLLIIENRRWSAVPARAYQIYPATPDSPKAPKVYKGLEIEVQFDAAACIHAAECLHRLPEVFDLSKRPWVNADAASNEAVMQAIDHCPSGALRYSPVES